MFQKEVLITQPLTSEHACPLWFLHFKAEEDVLRTGLTQLATGEVLVRACR